MEAERIKELIGKQLTKELHHEILCFNGGTIIECIKDHKVFFDSGLSERLNEYKIGERDRLTYTFFELDTYKNWKIVEIK